MIKSTAKMQVVLLELRMKDLERVDQLVRSFHAAQIVQGKMLGLLVELFKDRFEGDCEDLEACEQILLDSQALSAEIMRVMDKEIGPRDQADAFIADFSAMVESLPDD